MMSKLMYGMRVDMKNIDDPYLSRRYEFLPAPSFLAWVNERRPNGRSEWQFQLLDFHNL